MLMICLHLNKLLPLMLAVLLGIMFIGWFHESFGDTFYDSHSGIIGCITRNHQ